MLKRSITHLKIIQFYIQHEWKFHLELVKKIWRSEADIDIPLKMLDALNLKSQRISRFSQGMKMQLSLPWPLFRNRLTFS